MKERRNERELRLVPSIVLWFVESFHRKISRKCSWDLFLSIVPILSRSILLSAPMILVWKGILTVGKFRKPIATKWKFGHSTANRLVPLEPRRSEPLGPWLDSQRTILAPVVLAFFVVSDSQWRRCCCRDTYEAEAVKNDRLVPSRLISQVSWSHRYGYEAKVAFCKHLTSTLASSKRYPSYKTTLEDSEEKYNGARILSSTTSFHLLRISPTFLPATSTYQAPIRAISLLTLQSIWFSFSSGTHSGQSLSAALLIISRPWRIHACRMLSCK